MELSKQQIDSLFKFTEKKLVRYYDVQVELVDHLANKIEEEMNANPAMEFDFALQKVYNTFGIFGFARIIKEKTELVEVKNKKMWIAEFKNFFKWPNLLLSICLALLLKFIVENVQVENLILAIFIISISFSTLIFVNKKLRLNRKLLLTQSQYLYYPTTFGWIYFSSFVNKIGYIDYNTNKFNSIILIGYLFFICISTIASLKVAKNINAKAREDYPEAFKIEN